MIAVIVLPGYSTQEIRGLYAQRLLPLLPLGDRSTLQHIVESLVAQGITAIELIVGYAPEQVEALLGNGDRWGCKIRYHVAVQSEHPYRSLRFIPQTKTEQWVLIHSEHYPCLALPNKPVEKPILYCDMTQSLSGHCCEQIPNNLATIWKGAALFPPNYVNEVFTNQTPEEFLAYLEKMVSNEEATVVSTADWLDSCTPAALLESQGRLLEKKLNGLMSSGTERQPGVWISRGVVIHPTVELVGPLYIGPNSRLNRGVKLGPNVVVSGECIVDSNTVIEQSLVTAGSYIGEGLELNNVIVDHSLLINVRLGTSINIHESFLLSDLKQKHPNRWFGSAIQSILALILIFLFLPISILSFFYFALVRRFFYTSIRVVQLPAQESLLVSHTYSLPCLGADAWSMRRPAGWDAFLRQMLPGLLAVVTGRLAFVGLPPRPAEEIRRLPLEWRSMYLKSKAGLITEASIALTDSEDETQLYFADAYYTARRNWLHDLRLASQYIFRLIVPVRRGEL
jgi:NDP-sugar pyrophosphorylase family protein